MLSNDEANTGGYLHLWFSSLSQLIRWGILLMCNVLVLCRETTSTAEATATAAATTTANSCESKQLGQKENECQGPCDKNFFIE